MTWQQAIRSDPEARQGFKDFVERRLELAYEEMETGIDRGDIQAAGIAKGKRDEIRELLGAYEAEAKEAAAYATHRRLAGTRG